MTSEDCENDYSACENQILGSGSTGQAIAARSRLAEQKQANQVQRVLALGIKGQSRLSDHQAQGQIDGMPRGLSAGQQIRQSPDEVYANSAQAQGAIASGFSSGRHEYGYPSQAKSSWELREENNKLRADLDELRTEGSILRSQNQELLVCLNDTSRKVRDYENLVGNKPMTQRLSSPRPTVFEPKAPWDGVVNHKTLKQEAIMALSQKYPEFGTNLAHLDALMGELRRQMLADVYDEVAYDQQRRKILSTGRATAYAKQLRESGEALAADILNRAFNPDVNVQNFDSAIMKDRDIRPLTIKEAAWKASQAGQAGRAEPSGPKPAIDGITTNPMPGQGKLPRFF